MASIIRYAASPWRDREVAGALPRSDARTRRARRLGPAALRLSLSACRRGRRADERRQCAALSSTCRSSTLRPRVLKAMRRPGNQEKTLERIRAWRAICPELTIRSTFIVGFPGETEEDFQLLLDWLDEAKLDRVGAFQYEPVAGAAANDLGLDPVPDRGQGGAPQALHAAAAGDQRQKARGESRQAARGHRRRGRRGPAARAAPRATRRRSTAPSISPRAGRCGRATS